MLNRSFSEEIFPNAQPKSPLIEFKAISPCPITSCLGEDGYPHLATASVCFAQPLFQFVPVL